MKSKKYLFLICLFLLSSFCIPNSIALAKYAAQDIAVTKIGFEEQSVEAGDVVFLTVTVEIQNKGSDDVQNVPITVYVGDEIIVQDTIPYLPAGETFNLSYDWAISAKEIPFKSNIRAEIGSVVRDENIGNDRMSRSFTITEEDGKIVPRYSVPVHRWITRQAVRFLKDRTTNQALKDELNTTLGVDNQGKPIYIYENSLADGAEHEDTLPRWLNHFYRPTDESHYPVGLFNALEWGEGKAFEDYNDYDYQDALRVYVPDDIASKEIAYYMLGHVLHLIEDVSLPEHTHLECHEDTYWPLPCNGDTSYEAYVTNNLFTSESALLPLEIYRVLYYLSNYSSYYNDDLEHIPSTPTPPHTDYTGNAISNNGIVKFNNIGDYIRNLAKISYYLNRYKADLSDTSKSGTSVGPLGEMFPGLNFGLHTCNFPIWGWYWYIPQDDPYPDLGCLDTWLNNGSWWEVADERGNDYDSEKDFYYIEDTQHAVPSYYKSYWDPDKTDGSNDKYDNYNSTGLPLAELYARDLIPLAIRYVAGAIELFWRQTHSDLVIENLVVSPTSGLAGSSATVSFTIRNQGGAVANASTTNIRLNTSSSNVTTTDPLLASLSIPSIAAVGTYNVSQPVTIPSNRPTGTHYIWAIADVDSTANQSDETNDKAKTLFTVTASTTTTTSTTTTRTTTTTSSTTTRPPGTTTTTTSTTITTTPGTGSIRVSIVPQEAANDGAQWKLTIDSIWLNSGNIRSNLPFGTYQAEFKTISGWITPQNKTLTISLSNPDIWIDSDPYIRVSTTTTTTTSTTTTTIPGECGSRLGSRDTPGIAHDICVSGNVAYIADYDMGLQIIDVSNPAVPTPLGSYNTYCYARGVHVSDSKAYVVNGCDRLWIIDVSNPRAPVPLGAFWGLSASDVYVSDGVAYVADDWRGLQIIDVSNPAAPLPLSTHDTPFRAYGVYLLNNIAYVADDNSLQIIDVSNPRAPFLVGEYKPLNAAEAVYVSGTKAYVATVTGLQIIDVSNPAIPSLLGNFGAALFDIYVSGNMAYGAGMYGSGASLLIIDVSNPAVPTRIGSYNLPSNPYGVYVSDGVAYVADGDSGLQIIDVSGCGVSPATTTSTTTTTTTTSTTTTSLTSTSTTTSSTTTRTSTTTTTTSTTTTSTSTTTSTTTTTSTRTTTSTTTTTTTTSTTTTTRGSTTTTTTTSTTTTRGSTTTTSTTSTTTTTTTTTSTTTTTTLPLPKICRTCPRAFSVRQGRTICKSFRVWNCGKGTLNWTVSEGCDWLTLSPSSGTSTGRRTTVRACVNTAGLAKGDYQCTVTISGDGASNSPQTCVIRLKVK